jgi:hypothetical protein
MGKQISHGILLSPLQSSASKLKLITSSLFTYLFLTIGNEGFSYPDKSSFVGAQGYFILSKIRAALIP